MRERWHGGRAQSLSHVLSSISGARRAVDSVGLRSPMDLLSVSMRGLADGLFVLIAVFHLVDRRLRHGCRESQA